MIENYLSQRKELRGVIQLIDIRHPPTKDDIIMKEWLSQVELPILVVATKADKISRGARLKNLGIIRKDLKLPADQLPLSFSAESGEGKEEIKEAIQEILEMKSE